MPAAEHQAPSLLRPAWKRFTHVDAYVLCTQPCWNRRSRPRRACAASVDKPPRWPGCPVCENRKPRRAFVNFSGLRRHPVSFGSAISRHWLDTSNTGYKPRADDQASRQGRGAVPAITYRGGLARQRLCASPQCRSSTSRRSRSRIFSISSGSCSSISASSVRASCVTLSSSSSLAWTASVSRRSAR